MTQINRPPQFSKLETGFQERTRYYNTAKAINGGLDIGVSTQTDPTQYTGNLNGAWANVTAPGAANTEFSVAHTLGRIPSFYWFIADRSCKVYQLPNTGTAWTQTNIFVKCDVASAILRLFIL